jgi:hypothetical protein
VNDQGVAVGEVCLSIECNPGDQRALLWIDGEVYDLNSLIPPDTGWTLFSAEAINAQGEIVCVGAYDGFVSPRGFKLTPRGAAAVAAAEDGAALRLSPNPTRGEGEISWFSEAPGSANLSVYDVMGRRVAGRCFPHLSPGVSRVSWSSLAATRELASGVYLLELVRGDGSTLSARAIVRR